MHITRLQTVHTLVGITRCHSGVGPLVNKFEQVSSIDHQMSVVGGVRSQVWCPRGHPTMWSIP